MPRLTEETKIWFDYPDDPDNGRVEIRHLSDLDIAVITNKATKSRFVYDPAVDRVVREQGFDLLVDRQETICLAVTDWQNFFGPDGKPMACSPENKRQWAANQQFMTFVKECLETTAKEAATRSEAQRKNS